MRLFLVDSSIYIYKAWYGAGIERVNCDQQPNQAFIGFSDFVYHLLSERAPQKLVFAFDQSQQQSQRKTLYKLYKANRSPTPPALRRQFDWCRQWVEALGISAVSSDCWEADDLIGSLASLHRRDDLPIVILTADKDLTQLIHEGDEWCTFFDDHKLDYRGIEKKYKVKPEQISEQLALSGDKVDNIPGIPLVGTRTAANLLRRFGTLANLRENLNEVGKMKFRYASQVQASLIEHEKLLDISSQLTRINCDIEAMRDVSINRLKPDFDGLEQLMEFHAMDKKRRHKWQDYLRSLQQSESV